MIIELENERDSSGKMTGARLNESKRRGVRIAAGVDRQLKVVVRIIAGRIGRETPRRPMLESLIHRQYDQLASSRQFPGIEQPSDVRFGARIVAFIPT